ncbi:MAG: hypothetical protein LBF12_01240 [Christensenellaceae bacterium]|jgi:hypothetical protein|nr:hypothetical protein [Christensenellaceae bacterium]
MDMKTNSVFNNAPQTPENNQSGKWIPVDVSTLGFPLHGQPNQIVNGPDGYMYRIGGAPQDPQSVGLPGSASNAIPTPPTIVQMPPIVQPIALVPYTSLNQPLLQYDPYSRPQEPRNDIIAPSFEKKPFRSVSFVALIFAIIGIVAMLLSFVSSFAQNDTRKAFEFGGIDSAKTLLVGLGVISEDSAPAYYSSVWKANSDASTMTKIVSYALPILILVVIVFFVLLLIKYLKRIAERRTPRSFSVLALINVIFCLAIAAILYIISNGEAADGSSNSIVDFVTLKTSVKPGIGLIVGLVASIALLIVPLFAKAHAFNIEEPTITDSLQSYVINP